MVVAVIRSPEFVCAIAVCILALVAHARAGEFASDYFADHPSYGCEANPTGDPIGGGEGYSDILTTGDYVVRTDEELVAALGKAKPGEVIFVPGDVVINIAEHGALTIPEGVTLAGDRGRDGSQGGLIKLGKRAGQMFATGGDNIRITGLRFEGGYAGRERIADNSYFIGVGYYNFEIDNCEIYNFNVQGVGVGSRAMNTRIHHNFIHHIQRSGLGYGVSVSSSDCYIIANRFDYCRHHLKSGGNPGSGYEAAWNHVGMNANGHHFDIHGGRDRGDGTDIAGDWMHAHHNTFEGPQWHVRIRGVPSDGADIHHNWFSGPADERVASSGNTTVHDNVYGSEKILEE
ncbi:MAG: hypothetical protein R6V19_00430 [Armatimonadota bacterium]